MTPVFTGAAAVAANGVGVAEWWRNTVAGVSGIGPVTAFDATGYPVRLAGQVTGFDAADHVPGRLIAQTDRWTQFALAAGSWALADAGISPDTYDPYDVGVVTASASGGNAFGQKEIQALWSRGPGAVGAYQSIAWFYAASTGQVSIHNGLKGPCGVLVAEQAGGLDAVGHARRLLRGGAKAILVGGTEAPVSPYAWVCQQTNGMLSTLDDPQRAYAPYTVEASGYVPGEGGAMLVLEDSASAERRGAKVLGRLTGYAASFDPPPWRGGSNLAKAIEAALADAGTHPDDIDVVFADAIAIPELDEAEAAALSTVFGPGRVPVTAPKTMTGRLYSGGPALDLVAALLSLRDQVIPPTAGVDEPSAACRLDLIRGAPRRAWLRRALVVARGCGGFNAAAVVAHA